MSKYSLPASHRDWLADLTAHQLITTQRIWQHTGFHTGNQPGRVLLFLLRKAVVLYVCHLKMAGMAELPRTGVVKSGRHRHEERGPGTAPMRMCSTCRCVAVQVAISWRQLAAFGSVQAQVS